jgi:mono/diheme cytochrome c family protein
LILLLILIGTALPSRAGSLSFRVEGNVVNGLSQEDLVKALPVKSLVTENPTTAKTVTYIGVDLVDLLNLAFGDQWKRYDLVKFVSRDGYQPLITREAILAHRGLVALREEGRENFSLVQRRQGETVNPGPFWLVWDTIGDSSAKTDAWLSWPWQLAGLELTRLNREFSRSAPSADASEEANRGFTAFLQHCIKCHQMNGTGGDIGPELNYPISVTEYWQPEWLLRFIVDPRSVRYNAKMVGFYAGVQNREAIIRDIVSYLNAMARQKIKPE